MTDCRTELHKDFLTEAEIWQNVPDFQAIIIRALDAALDYTTQEEEIAFLKKCEISLVFTDDDAIRQLNADHRGKKSATNVLSFPIDEDAEPFGPMLGDVVFAYETIAREAEELDLAFSSHLSHLCIHGFLHLLGYDHVECDEAEKMESVEIAILAIIGIDNPYAGSVPLVLK